MKIAPYYQTLLEQSLQAAQSLEPITFVGMFDCGVDYLFSLSVPLYLSELPASVHPIFIDLSGLSSPAAIEDEICFYIRHEFKKTNCTHYHQIIELLRAETKSRKVMLVIYLGQEGKAYEGLFLFLNRLRNFLSWRFSYVLFATTRILAPEMSQIVDKVIKRNFVPVLPLGKDDALVVLKNYEKRYQRQVSEKENKTIVELSGGNPGLIKALYLQVIHNQPWKLNLLDERIYFRLKGITGDLDTELVKTVLKPSTKTDPLQIYFLSRYGYMVGKKSGYRVFTPLLAEFLTKVQHIPPEIKEKPETVVETYLLHFTKSQRKVLEFVKDRAGKLVSKDELARVLWGEAWADKYSDWAIDQLLSTLRGKLESVNHEGKIVTKKGEGIIYIPHK